MLSSIFNSKFIDRIYPEQNWKSLGVLSLMICLLLTAGWEWWWRAQGYRPFLNDNKDLWALHREKLENNPKATAVIGSSRILFGLSLEEWEKSFGDKPIQLATVGTNASVYLDHLAQESNFAGTLLIGIVPPLFFVPEGNPVTIPTENIKYYRHFSLSQRLSHYVGIPLDLNLAFLEQEDLPLKNLLRRLPIPNRSDAQIAPPVPPYFMEADFERQGKMILKVVTNEEFSRYIKNLWNIYFRPPPLPVGVSPEQFKEMFSKHMEVTLQKAKKNIQQIQDRGGKVILVRYPSTGNVRKLENEFAPREAFWDQIVKVTAPDGAIHFEDHEELSKFNCPEESHLTREDAVIFTRELARIIKKEGYLP